MDTKRKLKQAIIEDLKFTDLTVEDIKDDEPLFGEDEGLGLDSLDAVELVVLVQRHFGVEIKDMTQGREAFESINSLVAFIEANQQAD